MSPLFPPLITPTSPPPPPLITPTSPPPPLITPTSPPPNNPYLSPSPPPPNNPYLSPSSTPSATLFYATEYLSISISTDSDCCAFAPNMFGKLPKNTIPRNYKTAYKRLLSCAKGLVQNVSLKCRKAIWLHAYAALWSNCKRTHQANRDFSCVRPGSNVVLQTRRTKLQI